MGMVMSFHEKYRHKQLDFERKTLKDLSINQIESVIKDHFEPFLESVSIYRQTINDMCLDYAVESYLLGASYGRLGYHGESLDSAYERSEQRFKILADDLFDFWMFWYYADDLSIESLHTACQGFMYFWWKEGFDASVRRYRLKLH